MIKKILYISLIIISVSGTGFSQSSSSYTRIGIGDPVYTYSGRRAGMGQLGTSVADMDFIGILNPAGWYRMSRTRIEFGLNYNGSFLADNNSSFYSGEAEFSGFTLGFPISTEYGIAAAAGIVPYSDVSYKVTSRYSTPAQYSIEYEGKGGLSKLFLGSSYKLPFDMIIGATLDYYFGNLSYYSRVVFDDENNLNSEYKRNYSPYSIGTTLGIISPDLSTLTGGKNIQDLRIGLAANIIGKMNADTSFESKSTLYSDTLARGLTTFKIPLRFSAGLSFVLNKNYLFAFDFLSQAWQDYKFNGTANANLRNASKISAGFEFTPDRKPGSSFWEQISYRAGLSYEQLPYKINGTGINEYSVAGGFSLPVTSGNTIDIGLQYASRGTKDNNLIKEDRVRLSLGISLGDLWFVRQER